MYAIAEGGLLTHAIAEGGLLTHAMKAHYCDFIIEGGLLNVLWHCTQQRPS